MALRRKLQISAADIKADPAFQHYQEKHDLEEETWIGYVSALQHYVEYTGLTLSELIAEARGESGGIFLEDRKIGERLRGFRNHLKDLHLSVGTIKKNVAGVKSFYVNGFSIQLPSLGRDRSLSEKVKVENKGLPGVEDIKKTLQVADVREKFIVLGLSSSGLSATDFVSLHMKDVKEGFDEETGITVLDMRRRKTKKDFVTFFSAEATAALQDYLAWRERPKPKTAHKDILKSWQKHRIYHDDVYVICKKQISDKYLDTGDEELRKESEYGIQTVFRSLASRAGIARERGMWNMFRAHKMRSWFFTTLINEGCPKEHAEVFMGHTSRIGSSGGTYYNAVPKKLRDTYLQYMPHLSLLGPVEVRVIETEGYKEIKTENEMLKERLKKLEDIEAERISEDELLNKLFKDNRIQAVLEEKMMEVKK